jgi:hypothetical protein
MEKYFLWLEARSKISTTWPGFATFWQYGQNAKVREHAGI